MKQRFSPFDLKYVWAEGINTSGGIGAPKFIPPSEVGSPLAPGGAGASTTVDASLGQIKIMSEVRVAALGASGAAVYSLFTFSSGFGRNDDAGVQGYQVHPNLVITDIYLMQGQDVAATPLFIKYSSVPTLPATNANCLIDIYYTNPGAGARGGAATTALWSYAGGRQFNGIKRGNWDGSALGGVTHNLPKAMTFDSADIFGGPPLLGRVMTFRFADASATALGQAVYRVVFLGFEA